MQLTDDQLAALKGHTPGPWYGCHFAIDDDVCRCDCRHVLCDRYMGSIADVCYAKGDNESDNPPLNQAKKNAHLIMQAPALLADLLELREHARRVCRDSMGRLRFMRGLSPKIQEPRMAAIHNDLEELLAALEGAKEPTDAD